MKKSVIALALVGILPVVAANAGGYRASSSAAVKGANTYKTVTTNRKTGGYKNTITNNFYYNAQPTYQGYRNATRTNTYEEADFGYVDNDSKPRKTTKKSTKSQQRKYFLAHPFFQPLQGRIGSITDVSYAQSKMDITLLNANVRDLDSTKTTYGNTAKDLGFTTELTTTETTTQFVVKEDVSYGISDTLALMLMAQYDKTEFEVKDWSDGSAGTKTSTSGLNVFGVGLQTRVADTDDYIAMLSAYYQYQKDAANTIMGELKIGNKIERFTLYGLARASYSRLKNEGAYGAYMKEKDGDWFMLSYKLSTDEVLQAEGGVGVFGVFNQFVTGKAELTYGYFDWHNQLNLRGEVGFQPNDNFALTLYASTSLYDSAKGKTKKYMNYDKNPSSVPDTTGLPADQQIDPASSLLYTFGDYKIDKYNEWRIGVQGILYF